jgi:hypothetical protein
MSTNTPVSQRLLQLPSHLLATVLAGLDEPRQIYPTILSHRAFYHAFTEHRNFILASIIRNQIPADLLPIALALFEATRIDVFDYDAVHRLLDNMNRRISCSAKMDMPILPTSDFVAISKLHVTVQRLRQCFADESIRRFTIEFDVSRDTVLSSPESYRIERALYRFQLASILWAGRPNRYKDDSERTMDARQDSEIGVKLFDTYSPWVNEQLHTIYTFLERKVCKGMS